MNIGFLHSAQDPRVVLVPDIAGKLVAEKHTVALASGAGANSFFADATYEEKGCSLLPAAEVLGQAGLFLALEPPTPEQLAQLPTGSVVISQFAPFNGTQHLEDVAAKGLTAFSLDMIPRTTLAQAMDVLSSMASIAGYQAVLEAASKLPRYFPMLTTAAGSIPPAKVLVLGAGVAGLQAIATAKRLGAVVEAFDTRAAAKEEVMSLGAKFVEVEGATDDKGAGGYAVEQTDEYRKRQQALIAEKAANADVIITTAQLRGRPAPLLVHEDTVKAMKPGSVAVDLAASTGGNVAGSQNGQTVQYHGVTIIGDSNLAAKVPMHASQLYAKNLYNFLKILVDDEGNFAPDWENEIVKSACVVKEGTVTYSQQ